MTFSDREVSLYLNDPADGDDGSEICDGEESRAISPPRIRRPCRASPAVSVEQKAPGNLEPEAWATLRRVLDLIEACKVEGDPQAVFAAIEEDLRARMAVPVEPSLSE